MRTSSNDVSKEVVPSRRKPLFCVVENASSDPDGEKIDDDYELDATVFLEGDEPSRTEWCAKHGLVVDALLPQKTSGDS